MNKMSWSIGSTAAAQPWGSEIIWSGLKVLHGKLLNIREGHKTSLKYHQIKDEIFFLLDGEVEFVYGRSKTLNNPDKYPFEKKRLKPGECMVIQGGCPYRIEAIKEAQVIEIGNRRSDKVIRLLDDYGRELQNRDHDWHKYIRALE
tara:strand:- start:750 stop:1187 length:438 start_codon:yes stop_codon:yes gene_type:complete